MIALILLAAGNSRRFQTNKMLHVINGKPMFLHIYEKAAALTEKYGDCISHLIVVTQYEEVASFMQKGGQLVKNRKPEMGISHSIHLGIAAADQDGDIDYLFLVCDMPNLTMQSLERLVDGYLESNGRLACLGSEDHYGNPAIFPHAYKKELLEISGDSGGKSILKKHQNEILLITVPEEELTDMDFLENPSFTYIESEKNKGEK